MASAIPPGADVIDLTGDQEPSYGQTRAGVRFRNSEQDEINARPQRGFPLVKTDKSSRSIGKEQDVAYAIIRQGPRVVSDLTGGNLQRPSDPRDVDSALLPSNRAPTATPSSLQPVLPHRADHLSLTPTKKKCLEELFTIFPDFDPKRAQEWWEEHEQKHSTDRQTPVTSERLLDAILAKPDEFQRPKVGQQDRKRKRAASGEEEARNDKFRQYEVRERPREGIKDVTLLGTMLKAEFPEMTWKFIRSALTLHGFLFQTHVALAQERDKPCAGVPEFGHGRPSHGLPDAEVVAVNHNRPDLVHELKAAREKVATTRGERAAKLAAELKLKQEEEANLRVAIAAGKMAECQACFEEAPMNRQIHCSGNAPHFTCLTCAETYIKTEVGESRCRVLCPAGCGAGFEPAQLNLVPNKQLLEKLAQLQQEKDIRDAGLEDLEECPFCDYKAILPPIEEDFEFRCANPECEKVSCRRCKAISHIPLSCEQHAKEHRLDSRHRLEEAMTAALVRSCNKCKKQYIKDHGCNKMICPSCGTFQCYACSETIQGYDHFDGGPETGDSSTNGAKKRCPLYENVEERHARDVGLAEAATRAQILAEDPKVTAADLSMS